MKTSLIKPLIKSLLKPLITVQGFIIGLFGGDGNDLIGGDGANLKGGDQ